MTWYDIIATITKLTDSDKFTIDSCASALECKFELTSPNRYRSDALQSPFEYAELISGNDKKTLLIIFRVDAAREEYAMRMLSLGKPIDIEIVSPPLLNENVSKPELGWEMKYSLCFEIGDQPVWFGIEEANSRKILVSLSIHSSAYKNNPSS